MEGRAELIGELEAQPASKTHLSLMKCGLETNPRDRQAFVRLGSKAEMVPRLRSGLSERQLEAGEVILGAQKK